MEQVQYSYPGQPLSANITLPEGFAIPEPKIERIHQRITLSDDVRYWQAVPRNIYKPNALQTIFKPSAINNYNFIVIPYCPDTAQQNYYFKAHDRQILAKVDGTDSNTAYKPAKLSRVYPNTKAYLHDVTVVAYDYNEPLPYTDLDAMARQIINKIDDINDIHLGETGLAQLKSFSNLDDGCMVNLNGIAYKWDADLETAGDNVNIIRPTTDDGTGAWVKEGSVSVWDYRQMLIVENAWDVNDSNPTNFEKMWSASTTNIEPQHIRGIVVGITDKTVDTVAKLEDKLSTNDGVNGYKVSSRYSTAHFPDFGNYKLTGLLTREARKLLGQTAPRSPIVHGALPSDWLSNNFKIEIWSLPTAGGVGLGDLIWSSAGTYDGEWTADEIIHQSISGIDVKIPDIATDLVAVVSGAGWFAYTDCPGNGEYTTERTSSYRMLENEINHNFRTMVQMPVKVQLGIRYSDK